MTTNDPSPPPVDAGWPDPQRPGWPERPERDGAHELEGGLLPSGERARFVAVWSSCRWWCDGGDVRANQAAYDDWRYIGPCLTLAEAVIALAAAERRWWDDAVAAFKGIALSHGVPWCSCNDAPAEVGACCDHMAALPIRVAGFDIVPAAALAAEYQRGQEEMRERAARHLMREAKHGKGGWQSGMVDGAATIRALPIRAGESSDDH
jgi:hypothetical protein